MQRRHVRCTLGHVPFDPGFGLVPVDVQPVYERDERDVQPVYETDGAPTQPWNVLFSVSSSFVTREPLLAHHNTKSTQETVYFPN